MFIKKNVQLLFRINHLCFRNFDSNKLFEIILRIKTKLLHYLRIGLVLDMGCVIGGITASYQTAWSDTYLSHPKIIFRPKAV